ncbi:hypothetical protein MRX96_040244 [Rhipicephalus microplus]
MKRQLPRRQGGCCRRLLRLREENARFILLGVVLLVYMVLGALLFRAVEGPWEAEDPRTVRPGPSRLLA